VIHPKFEGDIQVIQKTDGKNYLNVHGKVTWAPKEKVKLDEVIFDFDMKAPPVSGKPQQYEYIELDVSKLLSLQATQNDLGP